MTMTEIVWRADHENITGSFVFAREIRGTQSLGTRRRAIQKIASRSFLSFNPEKAIEFPGINKCDKIFAACWLDAGTVALVSKDNQFILWNVFANTFNTIPIPQIGSDVPVDSCGIHDIDINRSQSLLATGGRSPLDILVYARDTMSPTCLLKGHHDWVFGSRFIEDNCLVSASRDSTVAVWKLKCDIPDPGAPIPEIEPALVRTEHTTKVRAIGYHHTKRQIATASIDSEVKIWDVTNMDVVASLNLPDASDLTCMAVDETYDFLAIGYQNGVHILDMRGPTCAMKIEDDSTGNTKWGIRSVDVFHHFVSIGGGYGRLAFYDLRNKSYIEMKEGKFSHKTGRGWVDATSNFREFVGHHAIYSHKFDPSGGRLLVAGGPIMHNAKGSYAAVW